MMKPFIFVSLLLSTPVFAIDKVIYGQDNRHDLYDSTDARFVTWARSTAAMIETSAITTLGDRIQLNAGTLENFGICASERFAQQPTAASCSASLVGPDLIATAGHCITSLDDCDSYRFVFDYGYANQSDDSMGQFELPIQNVYKCVAIVERELNRSNDNDYALIKLDRPVTDRPALPFRKKGKIENGAALVVIGHPTGLPTKISDGANVRDNSKKIFFNANLDTFAGNSGSGVFNVDTGAIEGILVRGEKDYVYSPEKGCQVPNQCADSECMGEEITRITNIKALKTR